MQQIINDIRTFHRERCFVMEQRKRMHLALTAFLRMSLGWRMELPEAERRAIAARALEMAEGVEEDHPLHGVVAASLAARAPFDQLEKNATKQMEKLAKQLPVWTAWGEGVRAFGARSLAVIVGEAGDLSNYATHSKLWKRMGLAVMDGVRQGGLKKTASADAWIAHGYNGKRRSQMFVIGDCLVKQGERYREIYLARKEYERERATAAGLIVAPSAKIPKGKEVLYMSDGHVHKRAQRFMEKMLLKHLHQEWRKVERRLSERAIADMPSVLAKAA